MCGDIGGGEEMVHECGDSSPNRGWNEKEIQNAGTSGICDTAQSTKDRCKRRVQASVLCNLGEEWILRSAGSSP
jgi:hypothetical protein